MCTHPPGHLMTPHTVLYSLPPRYLWHWHLGPSLYFWSHSYSCMWCTQMYTLPHCGWNELTTVRPCRPTHPLDWPAHGPLAEAVQSWSTALVCHWCPGSPEDLPLQASCQLERLWASVKLVKWSIQQCSPPHRDYLQWRQQLCSQRRTQTWLCSMVQ